MLAAIRCSDSELILPLCSRACFDYVLTVCMPGENTAAAEGAKDTKEHTEARFERCNLRVQSGLLP